MSEQYAASGSLTTDSREVATSETWETQEDWEEYQSKTRVEIVDGTLRLDEVDIPASAIHHWKLGEGSGDDLVDDIGSRDATRNGPTWVSGDWVGDWALDGDGSTDYIDHTDLGDWFSDHAASHAVLLTIETTETSEVNIYGSRNDVEEDWIRCAINRTTSGDIWLQIRNNNGNNWEIDAGDVNLNDGEPHRVVFNIIDITNGDGEVWVDGTDVTDSVDSGINDTFASFENPFLTLAWYDQTAPADHSDAIVDDIMICDSDVSEAEIADDYQRQPWI